MTGEQSLEIYVHSVKCHKMQCATFHSELSSYVDSHLTSCAQEECKKKYMNPKWEWATTAIFHFPYKCFCFVPRVRGWKFISILKMPWNFLPNNSLIVCYNFHSIFQHFLLKRPDSESITLSTK